MSEQATKWAARRRLFRIVMWKKGEKYIAASTCQRYVVRQLKVKFIVLDLKSRMKFYYFQFYIIIVSRYVKILKWVGKGNKAEKERERYKPETDMETTLICRY